MSKYTGRADIKPYETREVILKGKERRFAMILDPIKSLNGEVIGWGARLDGRYYAVEEKDIPRRDDEKESKPAK